MKAENPPGKLLVRSVFQKCLWGCCLKGGLFEEVKDVGGGDPLRGYSNRPNMRKQCLHQGSGKQREWREMSRLERYLGQRCNNLEQTPAMTPLFFVTDRGTNFLSCEDSGMPAAS